MNNQIIKTISEALDHLGGDINMRRDRPYSGQPHTDSGIRGSQLVVGLTMRDIKDAFIRAVIISHPTIKDETVKDIQPNRTLYEEAKKGPNACICENDVYTLKGNADMLAVGQNLTCELERLMGIYPNLPGYKGAGYEEDPVKLATYIDSDIEKIIKGT